MIRQARMAGRPALVGCLAVLTWVAVAGCGGKTIDPKTFKASDFGKASTLVGGVADGASAGAERFELLFVKGSAPKPEDRPKYAKPKKFKLDGDPQVEGDVVTMDVVVVNEDPKTEEQTELGRVKWTAVRDGEAFLLKDAPLPP